MLTSRKRIYFIYIFLTFFILNSVELNAQDDSEIRYLNYDYEDHDTFKKDNKEYFWKITLWADRFSIFQYENRLDITFKGGATAENELNKDNPELTDGQKVSLRFYIGREILKEWVWSCEDFKKYDIVELKYANNDNDSYSYTYYNKSYSVENVKVEFELESFVCANAVHIDTVDQRKKMVERESWESKMFTLPTHPPIIYIGPSEIDFGPGSGTETITNAFTVENHGYGTFEWWANEIKDWLKINKYHGNGGDKIDVTVIRSKIPQDELNKIEHQGTIEFSTNNAGTESVIVNASIVEPSTPQNLTISNTGGNPHLTWNAVNLAYRYKIFRKPYIETGDWQQIGITPSNSYTDYDVIITGQNNADDKFYYKVIAFNAAGSSGSSNTVSTWGITMQESDNSEPQLVLMQNSIPEHYELMNCFPNPGNPGTCIKYTLPEACHVVLKVINVQGKTVRTLVNGQKPAGFHSAYWDGRNDNRSEESSGIYIIVLRAGGRVFHKKYSLIK